MSERLPPPEEAIKILIENGCSLPVVDHCKAVAELALKIAEKCAKNGVKVNVELVRIGALLHDIGRSRTHTVHHAVVGADIARSLNLPQSIVSIIERHVGGGISESEASELGWPKKDYIPRTIEEKIVAYADKLIEDAKVVPIEVTLKKLEGELGSNHPAIRRIVNLHEEILALCEGTGTSLSHNQSSS
ncbi:MAG: TIGR00295 family protein [Nitrososphaerota archaeon]|nr:TIGR00295 family protein [Candidatus Bathyarchaeota archaeon]MDW8048923.1 TIGR00295 family protein [Nitrososphaerota archaeon]